LRIEHQQAAGHGADDPVGIILHFLQYPALGLEVAVQGQAHVEQHDLQQGVVAGQEAADVAITLFPDQRHQPGQVLAVGADVPLRLQTDLVVHLAHSQAIGDVGIAIITCGQAAEIRGLGIMQAVQCLLVRNQAAHRLEAQEVAVEHLAERHARRSDELMQIAQASAVLLGKFQKCLALGNLPRIKRRGCRRLALGG